jgi:DNA-binding response OmpR family regulator
LILLSERPTEDAILRGLDSGADAYLAKPISLRQLLARMQALLRRVAPDSPHASELRVGTWVFDPVQRTVTTAPGQQVRLTPIQGDLLHVLLANLGRVVPYAELVRVCWGHQHERSSRPLKTHITHLRRKLGLADRGRTAIQAVTGVGYRLLLPHAE